jgi:hypothetical protein
MKITHVGKQQKDCRRSEQLWESRWLKQNHTWPEVQKMLQGHAAGWMAGVAWAKRNIKPKTVAAMTNEKR